MPGIVGLITKMPSAWAQERVARMVDAVRHEPFYQTGCRADATLNAYVGWTVQEGSYSDGAPFCNEAGDVMLVFSGDEYSEPGTAAALKARGHAVNLDSAACLVHQYEEDASFPKGLNGMFHGLVIDRRRGTVTLFNDRFGMHRVYWHQSRDAFYFAAEAKAILAVCEHLKTPDLQSLGEFASFSCVLENRTIFEGIQIMPAGSVWVFEGGELKKKDTYFRPAEWEQQTALEPEAYYRELREVLSRNLPRYFSGPQTIGMTLTGGMDTRVIMAWQKSAPGSLPCYTFGGMFRDCQDVVVARRVAEVCRQSYEVIPVGEEYLRDFPHYAERMVYLTEGGVDVYRSADLYVSQKARQIAPVKVVGTYGSEILRQAVMFKPTALMPGLFSGDLSPYVEQARTTYSNIRQSHPVTFAAFAQSPWYHHGILALEQTQLTVRSPYMDNDFVRMVYRAPKMAGAGEDLRLRLIEDGNPELARFWSDRGVAAHPNLWSSIARTYLEFTFKAEYAYDYGMPQWLAGIDHTFSALHLERLFLGRHKLLHFRLWYQTVLASYVREMLLESKALSRPYVDRRSMEAVVEGHTKGGRNYTTEIHKLLTMELLHRRFFDA